ncbi:MAG TPA: YihY/virulence factor BrkB family protein, partial [Clostridia bacterium]|nr:YihY/virulence factor BrkB family protein [Clostridia bacterium]
IVVYRCLPSRRMGWLEVFPGAIFSAVGWLAISMGFSFYVDNFGNYSRFYGSIGGLIALLVWLYLSAVVILIGGEINAALVYGKASKAEKIKEQKG